MIIRSSFAWYKGHASFKYLSTRTVSMTYKEGKYILCFCASINLIGIAYSISCAPPWQFSHGNSCYLFGHNPDLSWGEARIQCIAHGGYLAIIDNASEQNATKTYHNKHFWWMWYWIGGTDFGTEGTFYWEHTGKVISNSTYAIWHDKEPNGRNAENCLMSFPRNYKNEWNDNRCDSPLAYLCEKS